MTAAKNAIAAGFDGVEVRGKRVGCCMGLGQQPGRGRLWAPVSSRSDASCLCRTLIAVLRSQVRLSSTKKNCVCCVCLPAAHRSTVPLATCWISSGRTAATRELTAMAAALRSRAGEDKTFASFAGAG